MTKSKPVLGLKKHENPIDTHEIPWYPIKRVIRKRKAHLSDVFCETPLLMPNFGPSSMSLFLSTYVNKIDRKGRVSVPATFRSGMAKSVFQGVVIFRSYKYPALEVCEMERMMRLSDSVDKLDLFSDIQDDFAATLFADSHQIPFDGEGRILVPEILLNHAEIKEAAAFVGRGSTFQIWNPASFEIYQEKARFRIKNQKDTLKLDGALQKTNDPKSGEFSNA